MTLRLGGIFLPSVGVPENYFFFFTENFYLSSICLCGLGSAGTLLLDHHRLLALQDGTGATPGGHAQVLLVVVLANDVPEAAQGGTGVLVDSDLLVRADKLIQFLCSPFLACARNHDVFSCCLVEQNVIFTIACVSLVYSTKFP